MSGFESIEGLTLTDTITAALEADGITAPLPVQTRAMASMLAGKHVLMHAGTGSGKTLAYVLPVLQHLREHPDHRAVVIAPGAELVMQTLRVANAYKDEDLTTGAALSTTNTRRQRKRVTRSTRLVVGTPDRLIEMFSGGKLKGVHLIVFDELEPILGSRGAGFFNELLSRSTPKVQILVASATMGGRSDAFVKRFMADGEIVRPPEDALTQSIQHCFVRLPRNQPPQMTIARFLQEQRCRQAIVFAQDARHQGALYHFLRDSGLKPVTVTQQRTKEQRKRGLDDFREGRARVLLTTDAAARGIDVPGVDWVLHYDLPRLPQAYVHRAGRTGRAGTQGTSVVFIQDSVRGALRRMGRELDITFEPFFRR